VGITVFVKFRRVWATKRLTKLTRRFLGRAQGTFKKQKMPQKRKNRLAKDRANDEEKGGYFGLPAPRRSLLVNKKLKKIRRRFFDFADVLTLALTQNRSGKFTKVLESSCYEWVSI
jgi:hypothetical protein